MNRMLIFERGQDVGGVRTVTGKIIRVPEHLGSCFGPTSPRLREDPEL